MSSSVILRYAGWSACASGIVTILGLIFIGIFFSVGEPYGSLNDLCIALQVLLMLPVALGLRQLFQDRFSSLDLAAMAMLLAGALAVAVASVILVLKVITFPQSLAPVSSGFGLIGVWMIATGYLTLSAKSLPAALAWLGIVTGAGMLLFCFGYWFGPREAMASFSPSLTIRSVLPAIVGGALSFFGYPIWAIWLGVLLLGGKVAVVA
jgi:hypothetical protein